MIINKPYTNSEYANLVVYCEENHCHIEDKGDYLESVENIPFVPTHEYIRQQRLEYRKNNIDDKTAERSRKIANGSWTTDDEEDYLAFDAEITAWIEENLPYPDEESKI